MTRADLAAAASDEDTDLIAKLRARIAELEAELEELRCSDVFLFFDGELSEPRAAKFREHLGRCAECATNIKENAAMDALLRSAADRRDAGE